MNIVLVSLASHSTLGGFELRDVCALVLLAAGLAALLVAAYRVCKVPCGSTLIW